MFENLINSISKQYSSLKLCAPSKLYLIISIIVLFVMGMQNIGNTDIYCIGNYYCDVYSTKILFVIKIIYVLFWTWILNLICNSGFSGVSWFLVLFPFILLFLLIILFMIQN